ncbi:MAG: hypothetical protein JSR37_09770 [Verrucomicrobia bacterium]|nr:hypothetical protein [Verrucomicrobiota bacterium]MBS0637833.1 hypothetical protein [Verrucomicrobiota bacterium]
MSLFSYVHSTLGALPGLYYAGRAVMHSCMQIPEDQLEVPSRSVIQLPEMKRVFDSNPGLRKDIKLIQGNGSTLFESFGMNRRFCANNEAYILMHKAIMEHQPVGTRFFLRREIYLIQNDYPIKDSVARSVATLAASLFFDGSLFRVPAVLCAYAIVGFSYSHYTEQRGTQHAINTSTEEDLKGALCILEAIKRVRNTSSDVGGMQQIKDRLSAMQASSPSFDENTCQRLVAAFKQHATE